MPATELNHAMAALKDLLAQPDTKSANLPKIVELLYQKAKIREDAVRMAFWALVGDGEIRLNKQFVASLKAA